MFFDMELMEVDDQGDVEQLNNEQYQPERDRMPSPPTGNCL